jgi:hypothetical protein
MLLLATQAHGCYFMSWGMNTGRRFYESFVFHGWWQWWSRESIDVRSPAESRNVVGVRLVFSMLGIWALGEEARLPCDIFLHRVFPWSRRLIIY